ncbi:MAG: MFS transporter [Alphaproteobacteria bacterium]|jgi:MFS family permease|nr:MFS transporter [Alphaproteobacteria bacterium]
MLTYNYKLKPYFMWLFPLLFFAYQFVLRLWPGLMMQPIMEQFSIDASHFGVLAAFYYYGYAGMQIPVGILLDRFNPRYVIFAFAVTCGLATLAFTYTDNFYVAIFSRFLVGAGSAVGFLGVSKVVSEWFPKDQYARMIGYSFTFGLMGAIFGGKPVSLLIETYSWQTVAVTLAAFSILIGCGTFLAFRSRKDVKVVSQPFRVRNLKALLSSPVIWILALSNLLMVGSLEGFADVWGVQYLITAYNLDKSNAAELVSFVFFGMLFGGPLLAFASRRFGNYPVITTCGTGMALAFALLLMTETYNWWVLAGLFFCVGIMCCYQVIVFAAGSDLVMPQQLGVTIAFLNCINMLGGSFFHTTIGWVMDLFWTGALGADALRHYDLEVYKYALSVIPVCAISGSFIVYALSINLRNTQKLAIETK